VGRTGRPTAEALEVAEVHVGLHALGDDDRAACTEEGHEVLQQGPLRPELGGERLVDLDVGQRQPREVPDRGVPAAEVVQRQGHALAGQGEERVQRSPRPREEHLLGDLEDNRVQRQARPVDRRKGRLDERRLLGLHR
jgi:hypothetical protein